MDVRPIDSTPASKPLPTYVAENDWEKELNFKTWVTKAARFQANKRLLETHHLSTRALSYLSCYLIIATLLPVFVGEASLPFPAFWLNFLITSISILLLVFTQIESSADYKLRAHQFHSNALEIAKIYNEIRVAKHTEDKSERLKKIIELTRSYERTLAECENHEPIDYAVIKTHKSEYFTLSTDEVKAVTEKYKRQVRWRYQFLIWVPGLFTFLLSAIVLIGPFLTKK